MSTRHELQDQANRYKRIGVDYRNKAALLREAAVCLDDLASMRLAEAARIEERIEDMEQ
jgi:hypothetical protein